MFHCKLGVRIFVWIASLHTAAAGLVADESMPADYRPSEVQLDPLTTKFFTMLEAGQVEIGLYPKSTSRSSESITLRVRNPSRQPLTVELPPSLVAWPVLAQQQQPTPQPLALGTPTGSYPVASAVSRQESDYRGESALKAEAGEEFRTVLSNLYQQDGLLARVNLKRGPLFHTSFDRRPFEGNKLTLGPRRTVRFDLTSVCLQYGAPNPHPKYDYVLKPLAEVSDSLALKRALWLNARGYFNQPTTQAVAWHEMNGLSWNELAQLGSEHGMFTRDELLVAKRLVDSM